MAWTACSSLPISIFAVGACHEKGLPDHGSESHIDDSGVPNPVSAEPENRHNFPPLPPSESAQRTLGPADTDVKGSELLTSPPKSDTVRTIAHILEPKSRVGAYAGLPKG